MATKRLLILEDDLQYSDWYRIIFKSSEYELYLAHDLDKAKEIFLNNTIDIVLLDIVIDDDRDSGYDFCKFIKSQHDYGYIPVIFISALNSTEEKTKGFNAGADDYITKPFVPQELMQKVDVYYRIKVLQTELEEKNKILEELSITDPLTGAYNRRYMEHQLESEVERSRRSSSSFSLLMFDIDHFKKVNDTYGHQVGDEVLKMLVETAKSNTRRTDKVFRYGGEEFLIILLNTVGKKAAKVAEKIRQSVENIDFDIDGNQFKVTISIGISNFLPETELSIEQIINIADKNLYTAKKAGRNRVVS